MKETNANNSATNEKDKGSQPIHSYTNCILEELPAMYESEASAAATEHGTMSMLNEGETVDGEKQVDKEQEFEINWDADWVVDAIESGTKHSLGVNPELQAIFARMAPNSQFELTHHAKRKQLSQRLEVDYAIWQKKIVANLDRMHIKGVSMRNIQSAMMLEAEAGKLQRYFLDYVEKKFHEGGYDRYTAEPTTVDWLMKKIFARADSLKPELPSRTGLNKRRKRT